jgi:hypothetical protein
MNKFDGAKRLRAAGIEPLGEIFGSSSDCFSRPVSTIRLQNGKVFRMVHKSHHEATTKRYKIWQGRHSVELKEIMPHGNRSWYSVRLCGYYMSWNDAGADRFTSSPYAADLSVILADTRRNEIDTFIVTVLNEVYDKPAYWEEERVDSSTFTNV